MKKGRKTKYNKSVLERATDMAALSCSISEIAGKLKVSQSTVYNWLNNHKGFKAAIENARKHDTEDIEMNYYRQALPHDEVVEVHKVRGRGKKKRVTLVEKRVSKDVVNTVAAERILKVQKPERYGDKLQLVGGIRVNFNIEKKYAGSPRKPD